MKENINWNIVGDNRERMIFKIPVGNLTREKAEEQLRKFMKLYSEEIDIKDDIVIKPNNKTE